jgi:hypothetical protein
MPSRFNPTSCFGSNPQQAFADCCVMVLLSLSAQILAQLVSAALQAVGLTYFTRALSLVRNDPEISYLLPVLEVLVVSVPSVST